MEIKPLHKRFIYILFALSGFSALVYEILWTKYLSLTFGTTILAVSTVTATFMGGLALGSYLLGRYVDRETNLLRIYAFLELGIALTALLFPPTLKIVENIYILLVQNFPSHPAISTGFHFLLSALLLLPPAVFMGGTFPLMCRFFAENKSRSNIGRLYALNTLGATLGAFSSGFFIIPSLGLSFTGYMAIFFNLSIAAWSFRFSGKYRLQSPLPVEEEISIERRRKPLMPSTDQRLLLFGIGLIGAFSLAYEILWTRVFLLFLGNTTYAFSLMLSSYLVGITLGGAIFARKVRRHTNIHQLFVLLSALMGLTILAMAPFYDHLAQLFQVAHEASGGHWWHLSFLSFLIVFAVMCLPTLLSGSLLPACIAILSPSQREIGKAVGQTVLWNTVGAVLGSLTAGFLLLPAMGILGSFRLLAGLNLLLALALFLHFKPIIHIQRALPAVVVGGLILAIIPLNWDPKLVNSGVYCYAPKFEKFGGIQKSLAYENILESIEGIETTVAVKRTGSGAEEVTYLSVNGKTDASNGRDMATQILVGQIPLLLHSDPQDILVIGLGSGITLGGVKEHPLEKIDCVEISPEVVKASRYFLKENRSALQDSKVRLFIQDGRALLNTRAEKFDVIVSEPSNPWQTGNANLFTAEFYELSKSRLNDNGIFCQWIGLYDITPDNLRIACKTFLETFPEAMTFKVGADLIMVGASHQLNVDYRALKEKMANPNVFSALAPTGIRTPGDLIANHYFASEITLRNFSKGAAINRDDRPILEYSAPDNLGEKMFGRLQIENTMALTQAMRKDAVPLVNLGSSFGEVIISLEELERSYAAAGRPSEARFFQGKIADYKTQKAAFNESGSGIDEG